MLLTLSLFSNLTWSAITLSSDTTNNEGNFTLTWTKGGELQFFIYENGAQIGATGTPTHTISNLQPGTYSYRVYGCSSRSCSNPSLYTVSNGIMITVTSSGDGNTIPPSPYPGVSSDISYFYDALGRLFYITDTKNGQHDYEYDAAGNRKTVGNNQ